VHQGNLFLDEMGEIALDVSTVEWHRHLGSSTAEGAANVYPAFRIEVQSGSRGGVCIQV